MYRLVETPKFVKNGSFDSYKTKEVKEYFEWFVSIKTGRIKYLTRIVKKDISDFKNDLSRESVEILNQWLVDKISFRKKNEKDINQYKECDNQNSLLAKISTYPDFVLSDISISMIFDVGLYFGDSIINRIPSWKWAYITKPKNYIHYGQPIIVAEDPANNINPRFLIENSLSYSFNEKEDFSNKFLIESFDYSISQI